MPPLGYQTPCANSVYGIIEKVVFEPNEAAPERLQVWGAFMYVDITPDRGTTVSAAHRGYLYFRLRGASTTDREADLIKREWIDLKSIAGTGQAIGFGKWGYIGRFDVLQPDRIAARPSFVWERKPGGGDEADLRVRPASEAPSRPATYQTDTGIVKLHETGTHAEIVKALRAALRAR